MNAKQKAKKKFFQAIHYNRCQRERNQHFFSTLDYIPVIEARHVRWDKNGYIIPRGKTYSWQVTPLTSHITRLIYKKTRMVRPSDKGRLARIIDQTPQGKHKNIVIITKVIEAKGSIAKKFAKRLGVVTSVFVKHPEQKINWDN